MNKKGKLRNTAGLKACAAARNKETIKKVNDAIDRMKKDKKKPINFSSVAKEAGVAKATLYNNHKIMERIKSLRVLNKSLPDSNMELSQPKEADKINILREQVRRLRKDKKNLVLQLEGMEDLKDENRRLKKRLGIL